MEERAVVPNNSDAAFKKHSDTKTFTHALALQLWDGCREALLVFI
jgi:hypothetical protein